MGQGHSTSQSQSQVCNYSLIPSTSVTLCPSHEAPLGAPLVIELIFPSAVVTEASIPLTWLVTYEVDVAYLQRKIELIRKDAGHLRRAMSLEIGSALAEKIVSDEGDADLDVDQLCNVSALTVQLISLQGVVMTSVKLTVEVLQDASGEDKWSNVKGIRRRIYGTVAN